MKKDEDSWLKEKYTHISTALNNAYNLYSKLLTDVIIVYLALIALSFFIVAISGFVGAIIPIDLVDYINMSSSMLLLFVTSAYVVFTYKILKTTEESTKHSQIVVQQTANAQKIAYLERRLEKFYLPMESILLKNGPEMLESEIQVALHKMKDKFELGFFIINIDKEFSNDYDALRPFSYLACRGSPNLFDDFFDVIRDVFEGITACLKEFQFGSTFTYATEKNIAEHRRVAIVIREDIDALKSELAELVNL